MMFPLPKDLVPSPLNKSVSNYLTKLSILAFWKMDTNDKIIDVKFDSKKQNNIFAGISTKRHLFSQTE